ncbi:DinB family protein [Chitinophaga oryzae]|uniref:DinB family protein n=1 Tax=Chitinophaga oryzae TaxID=2725414 RepID=A0AAE6ZN96_9BACT|nr:DinB family protein [Chitinophaga oryzae]QJB35098.1 DinB family protein [Chitinophaga oryzae]QJB41615.1 DinB family protein [Chitinophaga oryzae]
MRKQAIHPDPEYFSRYIDQVPDVPLMEALEQSLRDLQTLDKDKLAERGDYAYAPGKWTVKDVLQHITDTERVFSYRALVFARNDKNATPGFDQDLYAGEAFTAHRSFEDVLQELVAVRQSTIAFFRSLPDEALLRTGTSWKYQMCVLAMGFTMVGHQIHHLRILHERYL